MFGKPHIGAIAHFASLVLLGLDRNGKQREVVQAGLCGFFFAFLRAFCFESEVSRASQAADIRVTLRRSGAEVHHERELVLRVAHRAVDMNGVVAEQIAIDPVPDLRRDVEEAETTLTLRPVEALVSPVWNRASEYSR